MFNIRNFIQFDQKGRAVCPSCEAQGKGHKKNLALIPDTDGAYKCHRGCTPQEIREILGSPKPQQIPTALAPTRPQRSVTVSPQKVKDAADRLQGSKQALPWLIDRGFTTEMIEHYRLGAARAKCGDRHLWAISIPIVVGEGTSFYQKKRIAPWMAEGDRPADYQPWSQYGIPQMVYFTHQPASATETWLCEGEWDAMRLGWAMRDQVEIAIACFTCGASNVPPAAELERLPGQVTIFYDRNDKPLPSGAIPGDEGAKKAAAAIGDRARIALVPMPENCEIHGWDVSNSLDIFSIGDFMAAARSAVKPQIKPKSSNKPPKGRLIDQLVWNDDLLDNAPDYINWLVDELLTCNELFLLAAGPRAGKSLLAMTMARSVASGQPFLGRPVTQGTVIYVQCEDDEAKIKHREIDQGWARGLPVAWLYKFKLRQLEELRECIEVHDARLVVLDTLSRIKDSDVSESSAEMSQVLEPLQELAHELDVCILLVHHLGKLTALEAGDVDIFNLIRGSSAIRAVCRGSMIIAAGERDYRLLVENGWGKHDLKVVLDASTLNWRLLGRWNPVVNLTQKEQIIDFLKRSKIASIEQIHEATAIPKRSLYEQLSRLQISEIAEEQVIKEGSRRNYTYRLALFNTIQQLNSVLNSENADGASDTGYIQQNYFFTPPDDAESDHFLAKSKSDHPPGTPHTNEGVEYTPSNPDTVSNTPIQHPIQLLNIEGVSGNSVYQKQGVLNSESDHFEGKSDHFEGKSDHFEGGGDHFESDHFSGESDHFSRGGDHFSRGGDHFQPQTSNLGFSIGDKVEIRSGRFYGSLVLIEEFLPDGLIQVCKEGWRVKRRYQAEELHLIKRAGGDSNANG